MKKTPPFLYTLRGCGTGNLFLFAPAVFFVALAVLTLVSPNITVMLIASVLMFTGLMLGLVAWKIIQLKRQFEKMAQNFTGNIFVETGRISEDSPVCEVITEEKKFFVH